MQQVELKQLAHAREDSGCHRLQRAGRRLHIGMEREGMYWVLYTFVLGFVQEDT